MRPQDLWTFPDDVLAGPELEAFAVEALDGELGTVDYATHEVGPGYVAGYIVVDAGPWILGKKVLLPAGLIGAIDRAKKRILVNRTKDEIRNAPEHAGTAYTKAAYRSELAHYYGLGGAGYRESTRGVDRGRQAS